MESGDYVLVNSNDKCRGGPYTRYDPSCPEKEENKSTLDLVLVSLNLSSFVKELIIDSDRVYTPMRVMKTKTVKSDHYPILLK